MKINVSINKVWLSIFCVLSADAMDPIVLDKKSLDSSIKNILVVTNDHIGFQVPSHYLAQMKVLQHALDQQGGKSGQFFPIRAPIDSQEFRLLNQALVRMHHASPDSDLLKELYDRLAQEDGLLKGEKPEKAAKILYTLGEGKLRMLVNAAGKVGAEGLSAAFMDYFLSFKIQDYVVPLLIDPVISCLHKKSLEKRKFFLETPSGFGFKSLFFSGDGNMIVAGGFGKRGSKKANLIVWDISSTEKCCAALASSQEGDGYRSGVFSALPNKDGKKIIVSRVDYETDLSTLLIVDISNINTPIYTTIATRSGRETMKHVAWSPDNKRIVVGYEGSVVLYDITNKNKPKVVELLKLPYGGADVNGVTISHDGKLVVVSGCYKNALVLIDISDMRKPVSIVLAKQGRFYDAVFSPDNKKIIVYGRQDDLGDVPWNLVMWDISDIKKPCCKIFAHDIGYGQIAFSCDGRKIIFRKKNGYSEAVDFGNLIIWDIENAMDCPFNTGPVSERIEVYADQALATSPDYKKIIAGDEVWGRGLILSTFLSDEEINNLRSVSIYQGQLLHQLICLNALQNGNIIPEQGNSYYEAFMRLPEKIRELLRALA